MEESGLNSYNEQKRHLFYDEPKPFKDNFLQISKIFDGFFIGNENAGKYFQFINNNKISLIINTAPQDITLTSFPNIEVVNYNFFNKKGELEEKLNMNLMIDIVTKLDACLQNKCQGAVIISKNIDSRVISIAILYFMIKYSWDFAYAFQFLQSKNDQLVLTNKFIALLDRFNRNNDRFKLSQAFQTDQTQSEEIILKNTFKNSAIINLPNFHGLDYSKPKKQSKEDKQGLATVALGSKVKRVKFPEVIYQIIESQLVKNLKKQIEEDPNPTKRSKIADIQKRLKLFIKEKTYLKQNNNGAHKAYNSHDGQSEIIMIKNKELTKKIVPKRRVISRTEESTNQEGQRLSFNNFFNIQKQDINQKRKDSATKVTGSRLQSLSFMQQNPRQADTIRKQSDRKYVIHNSKKIRTTRRCNTEEPVSHDFITFSMQNPKEEQDLEKLNHIFKVSKSNKNSTKKINMHSQATRSIHLSNFAKMSQKSMKMSEYEDQRQRYQLDSSYKKKQPKNKNIINFNFNVNIQNYNVIQDKNEREPSEESRKSHHRVLHSKKLIKRIVQ